MMKISYASERCETLFKKRHHVVLGISPFNSYFSEEQISYNYRWASNQFESVHLYVPDEPTVFTLQALGYDEKKAQKKARRQCNYLKNKIFRALRKFNIAESELSSLLLCHSELKLQPRFQEKLKLCYQMFEENPIFRQGCLTCSRWVLSNQLSEKQQPSKEMLFLAVKYFLAELPLFLWSPEILETKSTVFAYHQCPDFLKQLFNGVCGHELIHNEQGFVIINPARQ